MIILYIKLYITVIYVTRLLYVIYSIKYCFIIILLYVVAYVHIVTSDCYDIGHENSSCRVALLHVCSFLEIQICMIVFRQLLFLAIENVLEHYIYHKCYSTRDL